MEVICKFCEKTKDANDCWCCIDKGTRYYECKADAECDALKIRKQEILQVPKSKPLEHPSKKEKEKKPKLPPLPHKLPQLVVVPPGKEDKSKFQKMEIGKSEFTDIKNVSDWSPRPASQGFLSTIISYFTEIGYNKIKDD